MRVTVRTLGVASAVALLAGCSILKSNVPQQQVFVLRPVAPVAVATTAPAGLQLPKPNVDPALDHERIALVRPGNRVDYYAGARWGGSLSDVLDSLFAQRFRASGAFPMVDTDRGGFGAQYVIAITVRRFEAEYGADPNAAPTAQVVLECTVGNRNNRTTVASFDVATSAPAADNRLGEVVAALDRAANDAVTQVIERTAGVVAGAGSAAR